MSKEEERENTCYIQSKAANATTRKRYHFLSLLHSLSLRLGPQSSLRINSIPQSFLFSWDVSLGLRLVPAFPCVFLVFYHGPFSLWLNQNLSPHGAGAASVHHLAVTSPNHNASCFPFPASILEATGYTGSICHSISQK